MKQKKRFQNFLSENKLKKTSQRALVWDALLTAEDHPSVEDIRERLLEKGHRVGLSTIYRTIKILLESGMIRQSKPADITRYEALVNQPNHIHFICNRCGKTQEFPSRRIEHLIREETDKNDFQAVYSRYAIFGFCRECAKQELREAGLDTKERQQKIFARDALELTLAVERRGYSFYINASKKTQNPDGRRMFQDLAEEESEHLGKLQHEYRALIDAHGWLRREPARLPVSRKIADQIFPERELLNVDVQDRTTHLEALEIAIDLERKSHRFFRDFAKQLDDPRGRKIFRDFADEERVHLESLRDELRKLKKKGNTSEPGEEQ
jgi:Fur family ferric uptake transcriptional regulator